MKTGIETGREVVILTKDEDIQEQFYKLQWLLDTHYRGMLLADMYASDPSRFVTQPMPIDNPEFGAMFEGDDNVLVERPNWLIGGHAAPSCLHIVTPLGCTAGSLERSSLKRSFAPNGRWRDCCTLRV